MVENRTDIEFIISQYLERKASSEEIEVLKAWTAASAENRKHFLIMKSIWEASHPAFVPEKIDVEHAHTRVMKQLTTSQPQQPGKHTFIYYWQRIAAILVLPLLMLTAYLLLKPTDEATQSYQKIFTPFGTRSIVSLPDGSRVWLNAGSTLEYPTRFTGKERMVSMTGEGYFEVESNPRHPFIVKANKVAARATGTEFNVDAYNTDSIVAVTLVNGKVDVALEARKYVALTPGERIAYNQESRRYSVQQTDTYNWCSWKDGVLCFKDAPLEYVFKRLGQTYNIDFILKDAQLGQHLFRATFEGESIDEILQLIRMSTPIRYKELSNRQKSDALEKLRIEVYPAD
ncbi:MAG: FecR domain-containing protein [Bacteroides sp.]|nr:FecR domain-containing protein [Bacteroides sp.]